MLKYVLMDIEGTTTPVDFVHKVLFPYSKKHLASYVKEHAGDLLVKTALDDVRKTVVAEGGKPVDDQGAVKMLISWIDEDRKHAALKALQGMIWERGYAEGAYHGEIYPEVREVLTAWKERGLTLGIYSSGSVQAQKQLFSHLKGGSLTPLLSDHFDTSTGHKREVKAYGNILRHLKLAGDAVAFLSDVEEELDPAAIVGMRTIQVLRGDTEPARRHPQAKDFFEADALLKQMD